MLISFQKNRGFLKHIWALQRKDGRNASIMPCPCVSKLPCVPDVCDVGPLNEQPKVIIIGAGLAGLSAAQRLINCGIKNVTILEAAPRPGGRIYTCDCDRSPVDLGAQWIYGGNVTNMIFNLACQESLIENPVVKYSPYRGIYLSSDGDTINDVIVKKAVRQFDIIKQKAKDLFIKKEEIGDFSLWFFLNKSIKSALNKHFNKTERDLAEKVMFGLTNDIKVRIGEDLTEIPAKKYGASTEIPGGQTAIKKGFISVLEPMIKMVPKIMYKKAVRVIKWKHPLHEKKRGEIFCCDGTVFEADFIICTVSLGVLKKNYEELFCPSLPQIKINAINKLGFGNIIKIFFEYKKPFWIPSEGKFRLSWSEKEINSEYWVNSIGLIEEAPSYGKSLLITVGGEEASCLETIPSIHLVENISGIMRTFLSNQTIPYPQDILRSNWGNNAFTVGAVSYLGKDSLESHFKDLGSPLPDINESTAPVLFFAGEATIPGHYGTVQGARLSGIREAERILTITKRFRGKPKTDSFATCL